MPTIMITTIIAATPGMKYRSAADCVAVGAGACVGAASDTVNEVSAWDCQYA